MSAAAIFYPSGNLDTRIGEFQVLARLIIGIALLFVVSPGDVEIPYAEY